MTTSLSGRLLVATPQIDADIFRRSVVLLLHHDENGAHGLVLNKPLGVDVDSVLPGWSEHLTAPRGLFQGGPVGLDTALCLAWLPGAQEPTGVRRVFGAIGVVDLDSPPDAVAAQVGSLRIYAGYSGWGAGQLEGELAGGSWHVADREPADVFTADPDQLWRRVLRRQTGKVAFLALYPDDPEQN